MAQTGFNPSASYWGQDTNARGNCTNYVAYRLQGNGATRLQGSGHAIFWSRVVSQFGAAAINSTPKAGAVAWWGTKAGASGDVAYVERVTGSTVYVSESLGDSGVTILLISHNVKQVMQIADHVQVRRAGQTVARRRVSETDSQELVALVTGATSDAGMDTADNQEERAR